MNEFSIDNRQINRQTMFKQD